MKKGRLGYPTLVESGLNSVYMSIMIKFYSTLTKVIHQVIKSRNKLLNGIQNGSFLTNHKKFFAKVLYVA